MYQALLTEVRTDTLSCYGQPISNQFFAANIPVENYMQNTTTRI